MINLLLFIDLLYIEHNYLLESKKKINKNQKDLEEKVSNNLENQKTVNIFFEILIASLVLSIILVFMSDFSLNIQLSAAIEIFKLVLGSILIGIVVNVIQNSDKVTWRLSLFYITTLMVIFMSYGILSAIEDNVDSADDAPSIQGFKKMIAHSSKSKIEEYNKIIDKALKK